MTRAEAATRLSMIFANCDTEMCKGAYACKYCDEAISMAIEALRQEPSCRNPRQVDLISREDAIKVIEKCKAELTKPGDGLLYAKLKRLINECPNGE